MTWLLGVATLLVERLTSRIVALTAFGRSFTPNSKTATGNTLTGKTVLFFPYKSAGNRTQHKTIASVLNSRGLKTTVHERLMREPVPLTQSQQLLNVPEHDLCFESFSDLTNWLVDFVGNNPFLATGIVDSFIRQCPLRTFAGDFRIAKDFLVMSAHQIASAEYLVDQASGIVIGDSAYLGNGALVAAARKKKIPVWAFGLDGLWLQINEGQNESFRQFDYERLRKNLQPPSHELTRSAKFVVDRFSGKKVGGMDFRSFNGTRDFPTSLERKKVLFLHAFRDANFNPQVDGTGPRSVFRTYFEWADFALSVIAQNPGEWAIRPHPSRVYFADDDRILDFLLKKHGLVKIQRADNISVPTLLTNQVPIYTHSGTVSLETAIFGYKSHASSNRFPSDLVSISPGILEYEAAMKLSFENSAQLLCSSESASVAGLMLLKLLEPQQSFSPPTSLIARLPSSNKHLVAFAQLLWVSGKLLTTRGRASAEAISLEIQEDLTTQIP